MVSHARVLIDEKDRRVAGSPAQGWRAVWLFGWVMVAAGLGDTALAFVPWHFGVPEWEFGTMASSFSALPLISMGLAGVLGSALALGRRTSALLLSWFLILLSLVVFGLFLIFLSDAPIALGQVQGDVKLGITKAIIKTGWLALIFGFAYLVSGIASLRYLRRTKL